MQSKFRAITLGILIAALLGAGAFLYLRPKQVNDGTKPSFGQKFAETAERISAQNMVQKFMIARIEKDEKRAFQYMTERAIASFENTEETRVALTNNFGRYEVMKIEEVEKDRFRFTVQLFEGDISFVEFLTVVKVLDSYFIDSIQLAG